MFLKRIEAYGFKSFANRTDIEFNAGISAIVGPNGSGKSNVVDAVRWVLGEQSAKTLRGGKMQDVIFKGSETKKPLNFAEVTLVLDNSEKQLPIEFQEVSVSRRLYRNGESEYKINGENVRLQDIAGLFMDSGVGKEAFSIIGQGRIDEILNSKPVERRVIFEEAAGVLKYKTRKEKALRKLESTHENLRRVEDIIGELEYQVEPLRAQAAVAEEYLSKKEQLQAIEIAVLAQEITTSYQALQELKVQAEELTAKDIALATSVVETELSIDEFEQLLVTQDQKINQLQEQLVEATRVLENVQGQKAVLDERARNMQESNKQLETDYQLLMDKKAQIDQVLSTFANQKSNDAQAIETMRATIAAHAAEAGKLNEQVRGIEAQQMQQIRELESTRSRFQTLSDVEASYGHLFHGVKAVLKHAENGRIKGVNGVLVDLIELDARYDVAIEVALASNLQNIVVEDEYVAQNAIQYLKENRLGKATFLPITRIKGNVASAGDLAMLKQQHGFVDVASNLINTDHKYRAIVENLLGTTLVAHSLKDATDISKKVGARFRVVTLEGEVIHRGGSMTGGKVANERTGLLTQKHQIEQLRKNITTMEQSVSQLQEQYSTQKAAEQNAHNQLQDLQLELVRKEEMLNTQTLQTEQLQNQNIQIAEEIGRLEVRLAELKGQQIDIESARTDVDDDNTVQQESRDAIIVAINEQRKLRLEQTGRLEDLRNELRGLQKEQQKAAQELKAIELKQTRLEVEIDTKLTRLGEEYQLSYERACGHTLEQPIEEAVASVTELKRAIDRMGLVNIGAIEEFERVNERFTFLTEQKADLLQAEDNLLEIITEMDQEMESRFYTTFQTIQTHFNETFSELFGGGKALLELSDPDNVLTSGIDIIAQPPGKKLQHLSLLSGGERALTAISLLFALLKTRTVPFCILDEVEAALDDANVSRFANYLRNFSKETQFIVVTHRKGTMEQADILYGVTMQEPGITKMISVRLEEAEKIVE
ncbi:chromosome segregation protein SMC [Culicoidibacter larvae]|uniref:Chromosome partition protein Smc n=1 Tax=Culicoidibacter larvae TaxID=2579976 RepID=A0A5R8Q9R6_9FIRM|nr:chromosome segregation protein SMC [Culicoidibacter larvae]TLG72109.1 chromosome segregation protein SMC [Culicoidibacter larvae]